MIETRKADDTDIPQEAEEILKSKTDEWIAENTDLDPDEPSEPRSEIYISGCLTHENRRLAAALARIRAARDHIDDRIGNSDPYAEVPHPVSCAMVETEEALDDSIDRTIRTENPQEK